MGKIEIRDLTMFGTDTSFRTLWKDGFPILEVTDYLREMVAKEDRSKRSLTVDTYVNRLCKFYNWLEVNQLEFEDLKRNHLIRYLEHLKKLGLKTSTVKNDMGVVLRFIEWHSPYSAEDLKGESRPFNRSGFLKGITRTEVQYVWDLMPRGQGRGGQHTLPKALNVDELQQIRDWLDRTYRDDEDFPDLALYSLYRAIIELLYGGALRRGELLALRTDSLKGNNLLVPTIPENEDSDFFKIIGGESGLKRIGARTKTGERIIQLDDITVHWINVWRNHHRPIEATNHEFLFSFVNENYPQRYGKPFTLEGLKWLFELINKYVGLNRKVHPHMFRHGFATDAINAGVSIETLRQYLGHAHSSTTEIYAKMDFKRVAEDLDVFRRESPAWQNI